MYDSSWEETSRSSHPNLWVPPVITTMSRNTYSEPEPDPEVPPSQDTPTHHRHHRLPSVDEILMKISHQERAHAYPLRPEIQYIQAPIPQIYPVTNQDHLAAGHWQHAQLHPSQYQYDHLNNEPHNIVLHHHQHQHQHLGHFPATTHHGTSLSLSLIPQHHSIPSMAAKKRGRKKKSDTICSHCQLTQTPEWRRGPDGSRTLCNACGLFYLKLTKKFGFEDANMIFAYKKRHNEVQDRIVPTMQQKNRYENETKSANT